MSASATTEQQPQQEPTRLYGDEAIAYQKQVIAQNEEAIKKVVQDNNMLNSFMINILNQLPGVCLCQAPAIILDIMKQHDELIGQVNKLQQQVKDKEAFLADLKKKSAGQSKEIDVDAID